MHGKRLPIAVSAMMLDRALLKRGVDAIVESGGFTRAVRRRAPPWPRSPTSRVDLSSTRAARFDSYMLGDAKLVLTMERRHARDLMVSFDARLRADLHRRRLSSSGRIVAADGGQFDEWLERLAPTRTHAEFLGVHCDDDVADPTVTPNGSTAGRSITAICDGSGADIVVGSCGPVSLTQVRSTHEAPSASPLDLSHPATPES